MLGRRLLVIEFTWYNVLYVKMLWCLTIPFSWFSRLFPVIVKRQKALVAREETLVEAQTPLGILFQGLEGSRMVIPSIEALSPAWKVEINPQLESIRSELAWVTRYVQKLKRTMW